MSGGEGSADAEGRRSRKIREEEPPADLGNEGMSTATVALKADRYRPRIFGFQVNEIAKLMRWQEAVRDRWVLQGSHPHAVLTSAVRACRQVARLELLEEHGLM